MTGDAYIEVETGTEAGATTPAQAEPSQARALFSALLGGQMQLPSTRARETLGVVIGELLALTDDGRTPLVRFEGHTPQIAVRARSAVDLHGAHLGCEVVLMFERGNVDRPIVMGVLQDHEAVADDARAIGGVELGIDGERLVVRAKEQLVLRCGKASITLTKSGKVLIDGTYVLNRSSGVNRIKGGSVHLN